MIDYVRAWITELRDFCLGDRGIVNVANRPADFFENRALSGTGMFCKFLTIAAAAASFAISRCTSIASLKWRSFSLGVHVEVSSAAYPQPQGRAGAGRPE